MTRKTGVTRTPGSVRNVETGCAGRGIALAALAAPLFLSACLGGATTSQQPAKFTPAAKAGAYPARSVPAQIVDADHFTPAAAKKGSLHGLRRSKQYSRLWSRRAGEAGYIYIGSLSVPIVKTCRETRCRDVQKRLAQTAARRGADLLDIQGFRYKARLKTRTSQGKCLEYGAYTTVQQYYCPPVGGASCRYVDRKVRQCLRYDTKYDGSNREYYTTHGKVGLWRKEPALAAEKAKRDAARRKAGKAAERRWAANVSRSLKGHLKEITSVAWSPDGRFLASGSQDKSVRIWDTASGKTVRELKGRRCNANYCSYVAVTWSPDGRRIAVSAGDKTARIWDAATGKIVYTLKGGKASIWRMAWSPDSRFLAGTSFKTVRIWNAANGQLVRTLTGHTEGVSSVAWSPDGRLLASGSYDKTVRVWDAANGKRVHRLYGFPHWVTTVAWSPDGRFLASTSSKRVYIWDAVTRKLEHKLTGHSDTVDAVAWSPNGKTLSSGSKFTDHERSDNTLRLWSASGFKPLTGLGWPSSNIKALAWSPDGRFLAVGLRNAKIDILKVSARTAMRRPMAAARDVSR